MFARLKPMAEIIRDPAVTQVPRNNHYSKFYYCDKPALGFRDFYLKYWKGDRFVTIKPKRDRKKNIIPGKFEVYGKRGNYVFTAYEFWFEWMGPPSTTINMKVKKTPKPEWVAPRPARVKVRQRSLVNLPWNELFEI